MCYEYITKIEIKFDKKKTFKRKSIKYLQNFIFQESVKLPTDKMLKMLISIWLIEKIILILRLLSSVVKVIK